MLSGHFRNKVSMKVACAEINKMLFGECMNLFPPDAVSRYIISSLFGASLLFQTSGCTKTWAPHPNTWICVISRRSLCSISYSVSHCRRDTRDQL